MKRFLSLLIVLSLFVCTAFAQDTVITTGTDLPVEAKIEDPADEPAEAPEEEEAEPLFTITDNVLTAYTGHEEKVTVPDGVKKIGPKAFAANKELKEITLPDTVVEIEKEAFLNCEKLEKVTARKLKKIGHRAFAGCVKLKDTAFADDVDEVAGDAFDAPQAAPEAPAAAAVTITANPADVTCNQGDPVSFTVAAAGDGLTYQWQTKNSATAGWANTGLSGNKTPTLSFTVPSSGANYNGRQYRCIVTDGSGNKATSQPATLTVNTTIITRQPANATVSVMGTVSFTVTAEGAGLSYQWQTKNSPDAAWANTGLNGNKTATLSFTAGNMNYNGRQYRCIVTDAEGTKYISNPATLTVNAVATTITAQPQDATVALHSAVTFTVTAEGAGLRYQWQTKNSPEAAWANTGLGGNKTDTLSFTPDIAAYNGRQYRCVITDATGAKVTSDPATLTVVTTRITGQPADVTVGLKGEATFTVTTEGENLTYQWQTKNSPEAAWFNTGLNGNKTATLSFTAATAAYDGRQYRCIVTDDAGTKLISDPATLTVVVTKIITQPQDVTTNKGEAVTFTVVATGEGLTYRWQTKNSPTANWANTGLSGNTTPTLSLTPTAAYDGRQYRCIVTDAQGNKLYSDAATLTVINFIIVTQPEDATLVKGETATFTVVAEGQDLTYRWQAKNGPTANWANTGLNGNTTPTLSFTVPRSTAAYNGRQYRCIITNANGDKLYTEEVTLTVNPLVVDEVSYDAIAATKCVVVGYAGEASALTIPQTVDGMTVTEIGASAFLNNTALTSIDLPDTITVIRNSAFKGCSSLSNMN